MPEKFNLKWNDFQVNIATTFGSLRNDDDFADVTLACEDGQQLNAHKVILATSSPIFHDLLRRHKHPHPLIYMKGVKSENMVAIVDFLYYGEVQVNQNNLDDFLAIAEDFKLKGLSGKEEAKKESQIKTTDIKVEESMDQFYNPVSQKKEPSVKDFDEKFVENNIDDDVADSGTVALISNDNILDTEQLEEKVKSMMTKGQNILHGKRADVCNECGKEGIGRDLKDHIEAKHLEGVSIPCSLCDKFFRTRSALRFHKKRHSNIDMGTSIAC